MKRTQILIILLFTWLFYSSPAFSQGVAINTTGAAADSNTLLDVASANKGILIPRIDYLNRPQAGTATGMLIFVTANGPNGDNAFYYYGGTDWTRVATGSDAQSLALSNDTLSISNSNYVDVSNVFPIAGYTKCGNSYFNLLTDNNHCGSCTNVCPGGQLCKNGTCQ